MIRSHFAFYNEHFLLKLILKATFIILCIYSSGLQLSAEDDMSKLILDYISSEGFNVPIVFDSNNIKQFWRNKSVYALNDKINIRLKEATLQSDSYKIQLTGVDETYDCRVDVISKDSDMRFTVSNTNSELLSESISKEDMFASVFETAIFHIEDIPDYSFYITFLSNTSNVINIDKIIISFSPNNKHKNKINITKDEMAIYNAKYDTDSFSATGKKTRLAYKNKVPLSDKSVRIAAKIKNIGTSSTKVYVGYDLYSNDGRRLTSINYPYRDNHSLSVVSGEKDDNKIIVDSFPASWSKNCRIALNSSDDFSDIPSFSFVDGSIYDVKKLPNGQAEILLDTSLKENIEKGTKIRIHGKGGTYVYIGTKDILPNEEVLFISNNISRNDKHLAYSEDYFPKGAFFVVPVILSYSVNSSLENTILVSDFKILY